ncbi:coxsackievirus and adenovirus receptor homolog [Scomber japonicus]|uniref:coxsackievirus and adenovirus receptor homolog n=1 Tax=Scomber japonicus TaxID=13676 RepID=UPI002306A4EF|nr:coxsackievirus and adenovirus receptor homolog [Scomber japonicus]
MARSLLLLTGCLLMWSLVSSLDDQQAIKVKSGDDVILPCHSPTRNEAIVLLEWSRSDLMTEINGYVLFVKENRQYNAFQYPSFRGRVQLQDPDVKDGDVSVTLKNVNISDTGTYECHVISGNRETAGRETDHSELIQLTVTESGWREIYKDGGHVGLAAIVSFMIVMIFMKGIKRCIYRPPAEKIGNQQQV